MNKKNEMRDSKTEDWYEKNQKFNPLVSWLHSFRYKNILEVFEELSAINNGKSLRVVEIGCAHAKLYSLLNDKYEIDYIGIEKEKSYFEIAYRRYHNQPNFNILYSTAEKELSHVVDVDIVVALETLEHIPEQIVVRIIEQIAKLQPKLFVCSVPIEIGPSIWLKNVGSFVNGYYRHEEYTWRETFWAGLGKLDKLPPHGIGHKGFDWRWLAQTIRHSMKIKEMRKFPINIFPTAFSTTVFFIAEPRES